MENKICVQNSWNSTKRTNNARTFETLMALLVPYSCVSYYIRKHGAVILDVKR